MMTVVADRAHTNNHYGYEKERFGVRPTFGQANGFQNPKSIVDQPHKSAITPNSSSDDLLEEEIRQAMMEEQQQRMLTSVPQRRRLLSRSNSVNMYTNRRSALTTFDSERRLLPPTNHSMTALSDRSKSTGNSFNTLDSIHSRATVAAMDESRRQWHDSIHSRVSSSHHHNHSAIGTTSVKMASASSSTSSSYCSEMEDSTCSFASFGGEQAESSSITTTSVATPDDDMADCSAKMDAIRLASKSFTSSLDDGDASPTSATPFPCPTMATTATTINNNNKLLMRQASMRLKRGPSFRGSLSLIQENNF